MKIFLVLSLFVAVAFAGVGRLTAQDEEDVIRLYRTICSNQQEGGSDGDISVYCKFPKDAPQEILREHEIKSDGAGTASKQVVFIRPQSNIYNHQLTLTGTSEHNRDTTIYVLPKTDQHEIDVKDQRVTSTKGDKPHLFYLKTDPHGNDESRQEFSRSPIISAIRDDRDFRPLSRSTILSSNLDDRDFRPSFSSSPARKFDDRDFRPSFSSSPVRNFDDRDFRPSFSSSPNRNFDDRDFRPSFSSSPNVRNFDERDFRPAFSRSPIISSSNENLGSGSTRVRFSTRN